MSSFQPPFFKLRFRGLVPQTLNFPALIDAGFDAGVDSVFGPEGDPTYFVERSAPAGATSDMGTVAAGTTVDLVYVGDANTNGGFIRFSAVSGGADFELEGWTDGADQAATLTTPYTMDTGDAIAPLFSGGSTTYTFALAAGAAGAVAMELNAYDASGNLVDTITIEADRT